MSEPSIKEVLALVPVQQAPSIAHDKTLSGQEDIFEKEDVFIFENISLGQSCFTRLDGYLPIKLKIDPGGLREQRQRVLFCGTECDFLIRKAVLSIEQSYGLSGKSLSVAQRSNMLIAAVCDELMYMPANMETEIERLVKEKNVSVTTLSEGFITERKGLLSRMRQQECRTTSEGPQIPLCQEENKIALR